MQSRARRCFVHVGPAKTGTSYLQNVLWASRDALSSQRLTLLLDHRERYHLALALRDLLTEGNFPPEAFAAPDRLRTAAASLRADSDALITQERLGGATPEQALRLLELLPGWEVHVVITARDLGRQIPSVWQQMMKKRQTLGYDDFLQAVVERSPAAEHFWFRQDLVGVSARWSSVISPERMHIVTVPPSGSAPSLLLERFCSVIGLDPTPLDTTAAFSNPSLGHAQAEVLRRANLALEEALGDKDAPAAKWGSTYLAKEVLASQAGRPVEFPPAMHEWCRQTSAETIDELRTRGYDVVGDLAELMPKFGSSSQAGAPLSDAEVAEAATRALATVVAQRYDDQEQRRRLRARLRQHSERPATRKRAAGQPRGEK